MPRQHDPTLSRRHWVYDRRDVSRIFDVGDSTISSWIQRGLEPVDGKRPQLFAGHTLHHFLSRLRWPHGRQPEKGRLYCEPCSGFKTPAPDSASAIPLDIGRYQLTGKCTDCHGKLKAFVSTRDLLEIQERSFNNPRHTPDVSMGGVSGGTGRSAPSILPETSKTNQRWLYDYRVFLEGHEELEVDTIDEHLRALARMSFHFGHRPFEKIVIRDVLAFKSAMREACDPEDGEALSRSTLIHTLQSAAAARISAASMRLASMGSRPSATALRASIASLRACAMPTSGYAPRPRSRRRPVTGETNRKNQLPCPRAEDGRR